MFAGFRVGENRLEMVADMIAVNVENGQHRSPVGKAHALRDAQALVVGFRQHVRLLVVDVLQPVFESAQEDIGFAQLLFGFGGEQLPADQ